MTFFGELFCSWFILIFLLYSVVKSVRMIGLLSDICWASTYFVVRSRCHKKLRIISKFLSSKVMQSIVLDYILNWVLLTRFTSNNDISPLQILEFLIIIRLAPGAGFKDVCARWKPRREVNRLTRNRSLTASLPRR